jgi:hypothetical protein
MDRKKGTRESDGMILISQVQSPIALSVSSGDILIDAL